MLLNLLTIGVLGFVGVRLVSGARFSLRGQGRTYTLLIVRGIRPRHLLMETCYKAFRREVLDSLTIEEDRFGIEPEITAKVARGGWRVYEVGISYDGRTYAEGKKIGWKDGVRALYCIVKYSSVPARRPR